MASFVFKPIFFLVQLESLFLPSLCYFISIFVKPFLPICYCVLYFSTFAIVIGFLLISCSISLIFIFFILLQMLRLFYCFYMFQSCTYYYTVAVCICSVTSRISQQSTMTVIFSFNSYSEYGFLSLCSRCLVNIFLFKICSHYSQLFIHCKVYQQFSIFVAFFLYVYLLFVCILIFFVILC